MAKENKDNSLDIFGIKPIADGALLVTRASLDAAGALLSRICLPAAEEFGLMLRDRVGSWRKQQALSILRKTERRLNERRDGINLHAHPRLVMTAIENGSWTDSDHVQEMWAGLLASSCTPDGKSEQNLIFMEILSKVTSCEAAMFNKACQEAQKYLTKSDFVVAGPYIINPAILYDSFKSENHHRLDFQVDHMREIGLLSTRSGFHVDTDNVVFIPSGFGISFYVRCQGFEGAPKDYFSDLSTDSDALNKAFNDLNFMEMGAVFPDKTADSI